MSHYGIYEQDESVDLVMGGVIDRIDHLIDRLGKGSFEKRKFGNNKENKKDTDNIPGIVLPCETCAVRAQKRYAHAGCQTDDIPIAPSLEGDIEIEDLEPQHEELPKEIMTVLDRTLSPELPKSKIPRQLSKSSSAASFKTSSGVYTDDDNASTLSSDDEDFSLPDIDMTEEDLPEEVREYEIAAKVRSQMPELGTTETIHFKMTPHRTLYVTGNRKYVGTLPRRVATKSNYELNYHITVFKSLATDRPDLRMKKLKELVTAKTKGAGLRRSPGGRHVESSKLGNILVVDMARYSRMSKRTAGADTRIPVVNLRDGHTNRVWLSERVSDILLSRSPRLRFAIEMAKSNRAHWKQTAKDLSSGQRPFTYQPFYGGKSYTQFYLAELKKFVTKPLQSRCLVYYADLYEDNTKDSVKSKTFLGCVGNQNLKDSKSTPAVQLEDRIKEHVRSGQKLHDPKIHIFNVALQNPALLLDEPGRLLPSKGTSEITKTPNLLFVPLDFGFSSWSKPSTQDHLSALKQAYCDVFASNGPAGYNV